MRIHQSRTRSKTWAVRFTDHRGNRHKWSLFDSKPESEQFTINLQRLIDRRSMSRGVPDELRGWVLGLPPRLRALLTDANLLDSDTIAASVPLQDVLSQWGQAMKRQGGTEQHCHQSVQRVTRVLLIGSAEAVNEVSSLDVEEGVAVVADEKNLSAATSNKYLADTKSFFRWCGSRRFAIDNSILLIKPIRAPRREYERRPLSVEEARVLVSKTERLNLVHHRSTGEQRGLLYRFLLQTGLRAGEVREVIWSRIDWSTGLLYLEQEKTKARRSDTLPLGMDLLKRLHDSCQASKGFKLFPWLPSRSHMVKMLREDLDACGILWKAEDHPQGCVDMHSFRKTHADLVLAGGANTRTAMDMLRHTSPSMTMHYATGQLEEMRRVAGSVEESLAGQVAESSPIARLEEGADVPSWGRRHGQVVRRRIANPDVAESIYQFEPQLASLEDPDGRAEVSKPTTFAELTEYLSQFPREVLQDALRDSGMHPL